MKPNSLIFILASAFYLLIQNSSPLYATELQASDPDVETGIWQNFAAGTPNFPSNVEVTAVAIDADDRVWIGTDGSGIAVFDGAVWRRHTVASSGGQLASNSIQTLATSGSSVWIGTANGANLYAPSTNEWTKYTTSSGLPNNNVTAIAFNASPLFTVVFGTSGSGFAQCALIFPDGLSCSTTNQSNSDLPSNWIDDIAVANNGDIWIAHRVGITRVHNPPFGTTEWTNFDRFNVSVCREIAQAKSIAIDEVGGRVWFGIDELIDPIEQRSDPGDGVCVYNISENQWYHFDSDNSTLANDTVTDVAADANGRIWIATQRFDNSDPGGVYVCTWIDDVCYWAVYKTADGLLNLNVHAVAAKLDRVWFGTDTGVSSFALTWQQWPTEGNSFLSLTGEIWLGTPNSLQIFNGTAFATEQSSINVTALISSSLPTSSAGNIWVGTGANGVYRHVNGTWQTMNRANSGLAADDVTALVQDDQGRIWVGTGSAGVSVFDPDATSWATFDDSTVLSTNNVQALAVDSMGTIWVGTANGLARYNGSVWQTFTTADGLPENAITALTVDATGLLWAGMENSLASFDGASWTDESSRLPNSGVNALNVQPNGTLWVGTNEGAVRFNGSSWTKYRPGNSGLRNERVRAIVSDRNGGVWFGATGFSASGITINGGLFLRDPLGEPLGQPAPTIDSFTPTSGVANTQVTINGTDFEPGTQVFFSRKGNNLSVSANVISVRDDRLVVRVPPQAVKGPIRIRTSDSAATSTDEFSPIPQITSIDPASGVVGIPVQLQGTNLQSTGFPDVKFGDSEWQSLNISNTTYNRMDVIVPDDATSGAIQVRTTGGMGSGPDFTLIAGGLRLIDWEVHQGMPQYPRVAEKTTVVRLFLGTNASDGSCAFLNRAAIQLLRQGSNTPRTFIAFLEQGDIPNNGWFCNSEKDPTENGSIDFLIPGSEIPAGRHIIGAGFSTRFVTILSRELGAYIFNRTADFRIHASVPDLPNATMSQLGFLQRQLAALARTYPVRDGWGSLGSENGIQFTMRDYPICDGTTGGARSSLCGTGYTWDFWQEDPNGQAIVRAQEIDMQGATIDTNTVTWDLGTVKAGDRGRKKVFARLRPPSNFPSGVSQMTFDLQINSSSQSGSPDATTAIQVDLNAVKTSIALRHLPPLELDGIHGQNHRHEHSSPTVTISSGTAAPSLKISADSRLIYDADGNGLITPGDIVLLFFDYDNEGDSDASGTTVQLDYDPALVAIYGSGGVLCGSDTVVPSNGSVQVCRGGAQILTRTVPGRFFSGGGWLPRKFDRPLDENRNGLIDQNDLARYVMEFEDWDPNTGDITISTDLSKLGPGDLIRSFRDNNRNQKHDSGEPVSDKQKRGANGKVLQWNIPGSYMQDFNKTASVPARFSALWFLEGVNAFMGPGQGRCFTKNGGCNKPGYEIWSDISNTTVLGQEFGHSAGLVKYFSPNRNAGTHTVNEKITYIPAGYDLVGDRVVPGDEMLSIMWGTEQSPVEDSFFEPFEYYELYKLFRDLLSEQISTASADQLLYLAGSTTANGELQVNHSYLSDGLTQTPTQDESDWRLRIWAGNVLVAEYGIPITFEEFDWDNHDMIVTTENSSFAVVQPFPDSATAAEIWRGNQRLWRASVSDAAPSVKVVSPSGGAFGPDETISISWTGSDADGDSLTYAVRYSPDGGTTWHTLTPATTNTNLNASLSTLPGGQNSVIEVEATDGFHIGSDRSDAPFTVGNKPPLWATVLTPMHGSALVQSQPISLRGAAFDPEDGTLTGNLLRWRSDRDGALGNGEALSVTLTTGLHALELTAIDSANLTVSVGITVQVLADFDNDGLADVIEQQYDELEWWNEGDVNEDPDQDGLITASEVALGTDPGDPDSDGDGVLDGAEAANGSSPTDGASKPQSATLLVSTSRLDFDLIEGAANPEPTELFIISSSTSELEWTGTSDVGWISLSPQSGRTASELTIAIEATSLSIGEHSGNVTLQAADSQRVIPVTLSITSVSTQEDFYLPLIRR
ncbi:IPT/TIG domain-containing protein [Chloroflexi bacterium TSY]|nr:IPT/TIG domain-containing protein [Chloroflexi bacterium TSY]